MIARSNHESNEVTVHHRKRK